MGRLLRKKTPVKKKKQPGDEPLPAASVSGTEAVPAVMVSSSDVQKKQAIKKPPTMTQQSVPVVRSDNFVNRSVQFLREVKAELKKVTWPSRNQTLGSTVVVIILVMIISFFLGAVDIALSTMVNILFGGKGGA